MNLEILFNVYNICIVKTVGVIAIYIMYVEKSTLKVLILYKNDKALLGMLVSWELLM